MIRKIEIGARPAGVIDLSSGPGSPDATRSILDMLVKELPETQVAITQAFEKDDYKTLAELTHTLAGGVCYAGTPKVLATARDLNAAIRKGETNGIKASYRALLDEIDAVLEAYQEMKT